MSWLFTDDYRVGRMEWEKMSVCVCVHWIHRGHSSSLNYVWWSMLKGCLMRDAVRTMIVNLISALNVLWLQYKSIERVNCVALENKLKHFFFIIRLQFWWQTTRATPCARYLTNNVWDKIPLDSRFSTPITTIQSSSSRITSSVCDKLIMETNIQTRIAFWVWLRCV